MFNTFYEGKGMRALVFILLLITQFVAVPRTYSQSNTSQVKEVRYDHLQLNSVLPYQEVFKIKGSRNVFLDDIADAGKLTIKIEHKVLQEYFWWAKNLDNDSEEPDFEFLITQGLSFGVD